MKNRDNLTIIVGILIVAIVGLTIAYAALSTNLKVTYSNVTQNAATWKVAFVTADSVSGTAAGTSATGRSCGTAAVTETTVTVAKTVLSKPSDACSWAVTVKNTGSIAAKLSSITTTAPSGVSCTGTNTGSLVCGNITYQILKGSAVLAKDESLAASTGSLSLTVKATYTGTSVNASAVTQAGAGFTLAWGQA